MKLNPLWIIWFLFALATTFGPFRTLVGIFQTHSPAPVAAALPAIPVILALAVWLTHRFRSPRWEPVIILGVPILICLVKAPIPTLLAAALFSSAHTIGTRLLSAPPASAILRIALRFGLGIGVITLIMFLAGLAGLVRWPLALLLLAPALLATELWKDAKILQAKWTDSNDHDPGVSTLLLFAFVLGVVGSLWVLTPAIAFDPLKMHLASARWYVETGALTPVPTVIESYYPQGTELLMALLWLLGGQAAAQMLAPVFFLAAILAAAAVLRSCGLTPVAVVCGLIAAAAIPFLHWTAFVAKNDFPLAFFLLASLACLLHKRLLLATVFLAMAFGIKHVALFGAVGLTPLFLREIWQSPKRLKTLLAVAAIFLSLGTISLVRTYLLTGNPLYPESTSRTADFSVVSHPYQSNGERVMRYAGIPWLLHFDGQRAFESSSPNPMGLWLVFFALAVLAWIPDRSVALRLTLLFCVVYLLYWVSILVTLRYAIAPIMLITALTAPALFRLPRWLTVAISFYCLLFSLAVCTLIEISAPQLLWWAGRIDTDTFLRRSLPIYSASQALYGKATSADRVLALNGCPSPYAPFAGTVRCFYNYDFQDSVPRLQAEISQGNYRFLILPSIPLRQQLLPVLSAKEIYQDPSFAVYDLGPQPNSR